MTALVTAFTRVTGLGLGLGACQSPVNYLCSDQEIGRRYQLHLARMNRPDRYILNVFHTPWQYKDWQLDTLKYWWASFTERLHKIELSTLFMADYLKLVYLCSCPTFHGSLLGTWQPLAIVNCCDKCKSTIAVTSDILCGFSRSFLVQSIVHVKHLVTSLLWTNQEADSFSKPYTRNLNLLYAV